MDYYGEYEAVERTIVETICRLPDPIARFALDRCRFLSVGASVYGMTLPGRAGVASWPEQRSRNIWLIVLADPLPDDSSHSIVAHEIAHAWLKHDRLGFPPEDCEIQAAETAKIWGFIGKGADSNYCNAPFISDRF